MVDDLTQMLGRTILVGVTYCHTDGTLDRREQLVGVVEEVAPAVVIKVEDREERLTLPPNAPAFEATPPGKTYRLKESGRVVDDAAFLTAWTVYPT